MELQFDSGLPFEQPFEESLKLLEEKISQPCDEEEKGPTVDETARIDAQMWEEVQHGLENLYKRGVDGTIKNLARFSQLCTDSVPKDKHKGLANRRNILERLRQTADACEKEDQKAL